MSNLYSSRHIGVLIGRFQPFHKGHLKIIENAIEMGITKFKIFIGSANVARSTKNPFDYHDRYSMILQTLVSEIGVHGNPQECGHELKTKYDEYDGMFYEEFDAERRGITFVNKDHKQISILFYPLNDYKYNDTKWTMEFISNVYDGCGLERLGVTSAKYVLLGCKKDSSSWYLDTFPEMMQQLTPYPVTDQYSHLDINATDIREAFFMKNMLPDNILPISTKHWLLNWYRDNTTAVLYKYLKDEFEYIDTYKKSWADTPYPPIFVTVDALVQVGNNILLIQRKTQPGKHLWALPGGFINENETIEGAVIRELIEETGLKIPKKILLGNIVNTCVIDDPARSSRGRTITHVFHIKLDDYGTLPTVKGQSDARSAEWHLLTNDKLKKLDFFEDHRDIIEKMLGV